MCASLHVLEMLLCHRGLAGVPRESGHLGRLVCLRWVGPSQQLLYLVFNCDLPQAAATLGEVRPKDAWLCGTHTYKGHQGPLS